MTAKTPPRKSAARAGKPRKGKAAAAAAGAEPAAPRLAQARDAFEQGDWAALARLAEAELEGLEDRGRLALLAAAGLAQRGDLAAARHHVGLARGWGCPPELIARVLLSGAFNALGRVASTLGEDAAARGHFEAALQIASPDRDSALLAEAREIREKAQLGLLPEAARLMSGTLERMRAERQVSPPEAAMFQTQLELLNHMLSLAQRRGQLSPRQAGQAGLEQRAASQLGQDLWVLEQTGHKTGGFFVEFGATDGVLLSNTLLLETEFGWSGICAEPNPEFFEKLVKNRSCTVAPDCIAGATGREVEFLLADEYGGIADYAAADMNAARRAGYRDSGRTIRLTTISLDAFLKKYDAPRRIDYLSVDTEGSEYEILAAFPFEEWDIRLLTVEHNYTPMREDIRALLEGHGYVRTEKQFDDWYAKPPE